MGSGGAKKTNRMLEEETRRAQQFQDVAADRSADQYGRGTGREDWSVDALKSMWAGIGEGGDSGGGGGGPAFEKMAWESSVEPFYRDIMQSKTGLLTPDQVATLQSAGTHPIAAAFEALQRNLDTQRAGRGLGYGMGSSALSRDKAYEMGRMGLESESNIIDKILGSRMAGAAGLTPVESEKRAFLISERDKALANARSNAAAGRAASADEEASRFRIIDRMLGIGDTSLDWANQQVKGMGLGQQSITSRVDETPLWQKTLSSAVPSAVGAGIGAFTGGYGSKKKKPDTSWNTSAWGEQQGE